MSSDFHFKRDEFRKQKMREKFPELNFGCWETLLALIQTFHEVYNEITSTLSEYSLSVGKLKILVPLFLYDRSLTPSELAEFSGVTRSTMTSILDRLERDQMIERGVLNDRRMTAIYLTEKGKQLIEKVVPEYTINIADFFSEFTAEDHLQFHNLLQKMSMGLNNNKKKKS